MSKLTRLRWKCAWGWHEWIHQYTRLFEQEGFTIQEKHFACRHCPKTKARYA